MSWVANNAAALSAIGSVCMNVSTLVIIFFNLNQLKFNSRSMNVDINFKVFELRKQIYKDVIDFIKNINLEKGFRHYLQELENGEYKMSLEFNKLKESIDNCKHLFNKMFATELEFLLLSIEQGILVEQKILDIKNKDATLWTTEDQSSLHSLGDHRNEIINSILDFKTDQFLPYLNVANFHLNLMNNDNADMPTSKVARTIAQFKTIFAVAQSSMKKEKAA